MTTTTTTTASAAAATTTITIDFTSFHVKRAYDLNPNSYFIQNTAPYRCIQPTGGSFDVRSILIYYCTSSHFQPYSTPSSFWTACSMSYCNFSMHSLCLYIMFLLSFSICFHFWWRLYSL